MNLPSLLTRNRTRPARPVAVEDDPEYTTADVYPAMLIDQQRREAREALRRRLVARGYILVDNDEVPS